ncbi:MAG TPA: tetratricopeptide repeat protein [Roseiflexaceae bacterium]|nr:tetratricopeptide repeat protein [Roseiflexaceae bacterium]
MEEFSFGAWLQRRRRALDMTQADLGRRVGIAGASIRKIEADERRPSTQVAERLADALAVPPGGRALFVSAARGELGHLHDLAAIEGGDPLVWAGAQVSSRMPVGFPKQPLPIPLTSLIGRTALVAALHQLLARPDARLITLAGPGGVGKTRLALEVAAQLRDAGQAMFPDGVVFVSLAAVSAPALVDTTIAVALGLRDRGDRPALDQLRDALRDRRMLLVLDNAEHVVAAAPRLVALLGGAPGLRILVTSRAILHVHGEQIVTIPPLALAEPGAEGADAAVAAPAVQLFLDRARALVPGRTWATDDIAAVAAICRQLDGLPLAIELAAARCRLLSPPVLLANLRDALFETLAGGPRDLPARQQTLRATLDWSFGLLTAHEQALFAGLGLFVGGCTLDLARATLGAELVTLDALASLLDHSLVHHAGNAAGEQRFELIEVVRLYALERLAVSARAAARERWAWALLELAEAAAEGLQGAEQGAWLARLDAERPNLSALLTWIFGDAAPVPLEDARSEIGSRLVAALISFWWRRGYTSEGLRWVAAAIAAVGAGAAARARLLGQAGRLAWHQGELALAIARSEEALALSRGLGDARGAAFALLTLGTVRWYQGDSSAAEADLSASLALAEAAGDRWMQAAVCLAGALVAYHRGEHDRRAELLARSLSLARAIGDSLGMAEALLWSGEIAVEQGVLDRAELPYREAGERFVALGDRDGEARVLHKLADMAHDRGDLARARTLFDDCLAIRRAIGDQVGIAEALIGLGDVLLRQAQHDLAVDCYEQALALVQARGDQVDRAWAIRGLARVARAKGENTQAAQLFAESLRLAWAQANPWGIAVCLDGLGGALSACGDPLLAAALFGAADGVRAANRLRAVPGALPDVEQDRALTRAQLGQEAFIAALESGMARPVDLVITEALAQSRAGIEDLI